ncbi:MAG: YgaP family membrane protein [Solirubrobacterales bacterium]
MNRQIGPIGTIARAAVGLAAIAFAIAQGVGAWDVAAGLVGLPLLASGLYLLVAAAYGRGRAGHALSTPTGTWAVSVVVLVLVIAAATAITYVTPVDAGAIWLFFGASLLLVAARGDAGCEVLAVANAFAGRRESTGCIAFAPVDSIEAGLEQRSS